MKTIQFNLIKGTFVIGQEMTAHEKLAFLAGLAGKPKDGFEFFQDAYSTGRVIFLLRKEHLTL